MRPALIAIVLLVGCGPEAESSFTDECRSRSTLPACPVSCVMCDGAEKPACNVTECTLWQYLDGCSEGIRITPCP